MAQLRPKKQLILADNNMLIVLDQGSRKGELAISLHGKVLRKSPKDAETLLISDTFEGTDGYGIHFKTAFGKLNERFNDVDEMIAYLVPIPK